MSGRYRVKNFDLEPLPDERPLRHLVCRSCATEGLADHESARPHKTVTRSANEAILFHLSHAGHRTVEAVVEGGHA